MFEPRLRGRLGASSSTYGGQKDWARDVALVICAPQQTYIPHFTFLALAEPRDRSFSRPRNVLRIRVWCGERCEYPQREQNLRTGD
jgi:hypothetical protein